MLGQDEIFRPLEGTAPILLVGDQGGQFKGVPPFSPRRIDQGGKGLRSVSQAIGSGGDFEGIEQGFKIIRPDSGFKTRAILEKGGSQFKGKRSYAQFAIGPIIGSPGSGIQFT